MKPWLTAAEFAGAGLPGMPRTPQGVHLHALKNGWVATDKVKKSGNRKFYHRSLLPQEATAEYQAREAEGVPVANAACARRRRARLWVLGQRDEFKRENGLSETATTAAFCAAWNRGEPAAPPRVRAVVKRLSPATIYRWLKMRFEGDMVGLGGNYGSNCRANLTLGNEIGRLAAALHVKNPALTGGHIHEHLKAKGFDSPSTRTISRFLRSLRRNNREAVLYLTDPDAFRGKMKFVGGNRYSQITKPNQLWEMDASPADVLLTGGRHSIYVLVDVATRRMAVLVSKTAKTTAALLLLRKAVKAWGAPEVLRTDNGKDFVSNHFKQAMSALWITQELCPPFMPERKGLVERHIRTLQHGLMPLLPGYIGHNVTERQQIRARAAFAKRLGEDERGAFCVEMGRDDLQKVIDIWLENKYQHRPHQGLKGRTPFQAASSSRHKVKRLDNERVLDLLLAPVAGLHGWRTVTKQGIRVDGQFFGNGALLPGDKVFCRHDPHDMGRLYVFDKNEQFLCVAEDPVYSGVAPQQAVAAVRREQRARLQAEVKPLQREISRMKPTDLTATALGQESNLMALPPPAEQHATPQTRAVANALGRGEGENAVEEADNKRRAAEMLSRNTARNDKVVRLPTNSARNNGRPYFGLGQDAEWAKWLVQNPTSATEQDIERLKQWLANPVNSERVDEANWEKLADLVTADEQPPRGQSIEAAR